MTIDPPVSRAARFADGVRRRVAAGGVGRDRGAASRVDQVLRLPARARPAGAGRPRRESSVASTVHLGLRFDVHPPSRPVELRRELRTTSVLRRLVVREALPAARPMPTVLVRPGPAPTRAVTQTAVAGNSAAHRADPSVRGPGPAPARRPSGPVAVRQVHRHGAVPITDRPRPRPAYDDVPDAAPPLAVRWTEGKPGGQPVALTAADVPHVVDTVVREIDRRVTAARERKGWPG